MGAPLALSECASAGAVLQSLLPGKRPFLLYRQKTCCMQETTFLVKAVRFSAFITEPKKAQDLRTKVHATRRRRADIQSDTYVLMEPGMNEEFVSKEELKIRLRGWLENWPGDTLPPDLAKFDTIEDAVSHLVRSVCELEIDGEVGSVQWYQVQLE